MQRTRLTILLDVVSQQISQSLRNPWRRISLILVGLLFGNFAATVVATVTGQAASWDVLVAIVVLCGCELVNWWVYRQRPISSSNLNWAGRLSAKASPQTFANSTTTRSSFRYVVNAVKIGLVYGLFVEALKLGS
ncbi:MAG: DUF565 domain-containing protein [Cyanobacteria bacterium P01_F01_bin.150]